MGPNFLAQLPTVLSTKNCENFNNVSWKGKYLAQRKKLWESDSVNSYSTSKYETFYSFFTNSQGYFCKIESGRIFRRLLFYFQRLGCERQQVGTKPSINSCRIDLRCFILKQAKYHGSKNLINFCHLDREFSSGYQKVCVYNFLFVYDFVSLQGLQQHYSVRKLEFSSFLIFFIPKKLLGKTFWFCDKTSWPYCTILHPLKFVKI